MTREEAIQALKKEKRTALHENKVAFDMAIKALEQERSRSAEITQYRHDCNKLMEENERLKKALEQEPRWIPVSERLPEDHKDVLAYLSSNRMTICCYNSHKLPFSNNPIGWGYLPDNGFIDFEKENVIAWMPLPEPYREVEE